MNLKERIYSVLAVSAAEKLNTSLPSLLPESHYSPLQIVTSVSAARRALVDHQFDFVIINSPLPDDAGTRFAIDVCNSSGTVVLLLTRADVYDDLRDKVVRHGVFTLPRPVSRPVLDIALEWMESCRERLGRLEKKTLSVEEKMAEIRIADRAKWLLITNLNMDEPQAHRYLEKQAMDRCVSRREVAEEIIRTYG